MEDLIGKKVNMLTIIELDSIKDHVYPNGRNSKISYYRCLCDCGNYAVIQKSELRLNGTKSCGCLSARKAVTDISGMKSNKLTAISRTERKGNYWSCLCDCGNETVVSAKNLKSGATKSCGCANQDWAKSQTHDLTGKEFGRLVVTNKSDKGGRYWDCLCSCGNNKSILSHALVSGVTKSCGCLLRESSRNNLLNFFNKCREASGLPINVNISSENKIQRSAFIPLAKEIYLRDSHSCIWCSKSGCKLNAHHLETWVASPEKRFDKTNLVTLCESCHYTIHNNNWFSVPNPYMTILLQGYVNQVEDTSTEVRT